MAGATLWHNALPPLPPSTTSTRLAPLCTPSCPAQGVRHTRGESGVAVGHAIQVHHPPRGRGGRRESAVGWGGRLVYSALPRADRASPHTCAAPPRPPRAPCPNHPRPLLEQQQQGGRPGTRGGLVVARALLAGRGHCARVVRIRLQARAISAGGAVVHAHAARWCMRRPGRALPCAPLSTPLSPARPPLHPPTLQLRHQVSRPALGAASDATRGDHRAGVPRQQVSHGAGGSEAHQQRGAEGQASCCDGEPPHERGGL